VKVAGQKDAKLTAEGLFSHANITAADVDDVLSAALGVENVLWLYGPAGDAIGARAVGLVAIESSYEVSSDVGDVVSVKAEAEASSGNGLEGGVFLFSGSAPIGVTTAGRVARRSARSPRTVRWRTCSFPTWPAPLRPSPSRCSTAPTM
jgi:hypothetical protein